MTFTTAAAVSLVHHGPQVPPDPVPGDMFFDVDQGEVRMFVGPTEGWCVLEDSAALAAWSCFYCDSEHPGTERRCACCGAPKIKQSAALPAQDPR
jgi:hypothetical protein